MSEFKFACPVCGQHITCDSSTSGTQMECPTCFRKLIIPQKPSGNSSGLILTAALVSNHRPVPQATDTDSTLRPTKSFPIAALLLGLIICAAAIGAFLFRDKLFNRTEAAATAANSSKDKLAGATISAKRPSPDPGWKLDLANVKIPQTTAAGWINGKPFSLDRAILQGGTFTLRQGKSGPADLGVTVYLFAKQGEDLAGQSITITTNRVHPPRITLRWKDEQQQPQTQVIREAYALQLEFGAVTGNRLPGKIYLCAPDDEKTWVAGTFQAEIRKPAPPKQKKTVTKKR